MFPTKQIGKKSYFCNIRVYTFSSVLGDKRANDPPDGKWTPSQIDICNIKEELNVRDYIIMMFNKILDKITVVVPHCGFRCCRMGRL